MNTRRTLKCSGPLRGFWERSCCLGGAERGVHGGSRCFSGCGPRGVGRRAVPPTCEDPQPRAAAQDPRFILGVQGAARPVPLLDRPVPGGHSASAGTRLRSCSIRTCSNLPSVHWDRPPATARRLLAAKCCPPSPLDANLLLLAANYWLCSQGRLLLTPLLAAHCWPPNGVDMEPESGGPGAD